MPLLISVRMLTFSFYTPCNVGGINRRFGRIYCPQYYMMYKPRRSTTKPSPPWKPQISYFFLADRIVTFVVEEISLRKSSYWVIVV